ncbi:MAG TPA: M14 family zinc carboxypeptidase [Mycobacteriales bacterium]|nr:M14 family zinc carboxypeptidase [Mycobacteriales bacterium]
MTGDCLVDDFAPIDRFPTVDEMYAFATDLADRHPNHVQLDDIGRSRAGDPIQLLTISQSSPPRGSILVVGQPHPNEPIGMATIVALCERLAAQPETVERLGVAWHVVPCADPDGTRLNEGWFAGPWARDFYARHFYRPGSEQQVEWTFPFSTDDFSVDAPMPETVALMTAIDRVRPDVLVSLHNGELGGAYFYATPGYDALYTELADLCERTGVPLHLGDPETPLSTVLAPAVFSVPTAQQIYEMAVAVGADPAALVSGGSSLDYALRHRPTAGLVIELPYWRDPRAADETPDPSGRSRREVVLHGLALQDESVARLHRLLDAAAPLPPSPFEDALRSFLAIDESGWIEGQRQQAQTSAEFERPATVAEVFSVMDNVHMSRLRLGGMLLRAVPTGSPAHADAEAVFSTWVAEAAADNKAEPIPIRDLVAVQAGSILAAAQHMLGAG